MSFFIYSSNLGTSEKTQNYRFVFKRLNSLIWAIWIEHIQEIFVLKAMKVSKFKAISPFFSLCLEPIVAQTTGVSQVGDNYMEEWLCPQFSLPVAPVLVCCFPLHNKITHAQATSPWHTTSCIQEKHYRSWLHFERDGPAGSSAGWEEMGYVIKQQLQLPSDSTVG